MKNDRPEIWGIWDFHSRFPDEKAAEVYLENVRWGGVRRCPRCYSDRVTVVKNSKPMPYRCRACRKYFSVRTGTILAESKLPILKWSMAAYLITSSRKGISSVQLGHHLGVTQKTAWFLAHRIRKALVEKSDMLRAVVEIDETYIGGKEKNKHANKRNLNGRGTLGKHPVLGMLERSGRVKSFPVEGVGSASLKSAIIKNVERGSTLYTDGYRGYQNLPGFQHEAANHSAGEYVRGKAHTNGIESFWALLKRGYYGTFHHFSRKHLHRYTDEFSSRHNIGLDTVDFLYVVFSGAVGKRLTYRDLIR